MLSNPEETRSRRDRVGRDVENPGFADLHNDAPLSMCRIGRHGGKGVENFPHPSIGLYNRHRLGGRSVTADSRRYAGVVQ